MRHRNLSGKENPPPSTPRKSSRIREGNKPKAEAPNTPKFKLRKNRVPLWDLTPVSSVTDEDSLNNKSQKLQSAHCSINSKSSKKSSDGSGKSTRSSYLSGAQGLPSVRRSARLSKTSVRKSSRLSRKSAERTDLAFCVEVFASASHKERSASNGSKMDVVVNSRDNFSNVTDKMVNWSSKRVGGSGGKPDAWKGCNTTRTSYSIEDRDAANVSHKGKAERDANLFVYKIEKRVTRSASREIQDVQSSESGGVKGSSDDGKVRLDAISSRDPKSRNQYMTCVPSTDVVGGRDGSGRLEAEKEETVAKRKKLQVNEKLMTVEEGWTMEQQLALERAYFAAKPTPHFWKKVSKMVPGKSAQECFDKIQSELVTPPQTRTRSRAVSSKLPLPLSANELLISSVPETKKRKYNKPKSHLAHKKVRQLLFRQCNIDQDNNADLFSVLEQTSDPPTLVVQDNEQLLTAECHAEEPCFGERWVEESSVLAFGRQLSRSSNSCKTAVLTSPPVLKKVKNKALHEKYIDQLHSREARRMAASLRAAKSNKAGSCAKENSFQKMKQVKNAKTALIFCAKDAIDQYHHLQGNTLTDFDNTFDDSTASSEHEFEDDS